MLFSSVCHFRLPGRMSTARETGFIPCACVARARAMRVLLVGTEQQMAPWPLDDVLYSDSHCVVERLYLAPQRQCWRRAFSRSTRRRVIRARGSIRQEPGCGGPDRLPYSSNKSDEATQARQSVSRCGHYTMLKVGTAFRLGGALVGGFSIADLAGL